MEITVYNLRDSAEAIEIQIFYANEQLFQNTYHLDAGIADESEAISQTPTRIIVNVHNGVTKSFNYSAPTDCDPEVIIRVQDNGEIIVSNGCPTES